jgi:hypothetical protein
VPKQPNALFPFVAGAYKSRSPRFDAQRTVNLYPEASESGNSKSIAMLIGTPGTALYNLIGSDTVGLGIRGAFKFNATISIIVSGAQVWKLVSTDLNNPVFLGNIPPEFSLVSMATNGSVVMMVTGSSGWFIDPIAETLTQISDPDFTGGDVVYFLDGYFVWNKPGTQQFQISELYGTDIDTLDFASAEGTPDLLVSLIVDHRELWLMGQTTTEVFINSGNPDFPFERIQGAFIEQGCVAKHSVAKLTDQTGSGTVLWLTANESGQGMVVRTVGYLPRRISDHALEFAIASYSRIDDAFAYTYQQEGHNFYMLTFPTARKTWCYDTATELWHERASTDFDTGAQIQHRSSCHMFFDGKHIVGDYEFGALYEFSLDVYGDQRYLSQVDMISTRQCPHLAANDAWQIFHELWVDMETGVGQSSGSAMDPEMILEWSDDGGHSFPYSRTIKIGKIGERTLRAVARRLGKSRDRVFRVSISARVKRVFINAGCRVSVVE